MWDIRTLIVLNREYEKFLRESGEENPENEQIADLYPDTCDTDWELGGEA